MVHIAEQTTDRLELDAEVNMSVLLANSYEHKAWIMSYLVILIPVILIFRVLSID